MRIVRVFPTKTNQTPDDADAFTGPPPDNIAGADEVHISVVFTWDRDKAVILAEQWSSVAPVKIGGPGWDDTPGSNFIPGMYVKKGVVFTSRGCPNKCAFCSVWRREPKLIELDIQNGYIVQDDNLLACSDAHIKNVFRMLGRQRKKANFMALEAKRLKPWHIDFLCTLYPASMWFAYDEPADLEPLTVAGKMLWDAGFDHRRLYCYVLVGFSGDTFEKAEKRLRQTYRAGFIPFAMLYRDKIGNRAPDWVRWSRLWKRIPAIKGMCKNEIPDYVNELI